MPARLPLAVLSLVLVAGASLAAREKAAPSPAGQVACEGAFAIDSSEARLLAIYGAGNVWTGIVPGPEGTEMLATRVFDGDPERRLEFVWWDEQARKDPSYIELGTGMVAPGGVRAGLTVDAVEALNGGPFTLTGFGWDYGGLASPETGALAGLPGGCILSIVFEPTRPVAPGTDTAAIDGDRVVASGEPLLDAVDARVYRVSVGYPHPDFRD